MAAIGGSAPRAGVLLVSCYELGHSPLALASAAAFLERAGFAPELIDVSNTVFHASGANAARLVAIAVPMHTALRLGARIARRVRAANPAAHVCFFGHYAILNGDHLLETGLADSVIGGEVEEALVALAEQLERGGQELPLPGVRTRSHPALPILAKLPFPVPSRRGLPPLARYAKLALGEELRTAGAVEASRGCLHLCRHCPIPPVYQGRFFVVPGEVVLADVRALVADGARHISFADPDFLNAPTHALRLAAALRGIHPELSFDFTAKVEHLLAHRASLPALAEQGCAFIVSAVESLSDRVLGILDKGHTREDVADAIDAVESAGLVLRPSLLPFTPWTELADYLELVEFVEARGLAERVDPVQLSVRLLVPPGSLLERHPELTPHLRGLDAEAYSWRWAHPDPRMDALHEAVGAIVRDGADRGEAAPLTLGRIRAAARQLAAPVEIDAAAEGVRHLSRGLRVSEARRRVVPRMTEPWFC